MASHKRFDVRDYMWYIYEIFTINEVGNIRFALDMFIINVETEIERYQCITKLDYAAINKKWNKLSEAEKIYQKILFNKLMHKAYFNLLDAWKENNHYKFEKLCRVDLTMQGIKGTDPDRIMNHLSKNFNDTITEKKDESSSSIQEPPKKKRGRAKKIVDIVLSN